MHALVASRAGTCVRLIIMLGSRRPVAGRVATVERQRGRMTA
jgi:hypothetical protein